MKAKILSVLFILWAFNHVSAQTSEGSISYTVSTDNLNTGGDAATQASIVAMMKNMKITMYFKGKNSCMTTDMGMMTSSTISVNDKVTMLIDAMGMKYKVSPTADQLKKQKMNEKDYTITYTDETKTVAGYECKKAVVKMKDGTTTDVYYTDKIFPDAAKNLPYTNLKGCPLQYSIKKNGTNMTMVATEVSTKPVSDDLFTIPDGYTDMPESMKSQMFGNK